MQRILSIVLLVLLSACASNYPARQALPLSAGQLTPAANQGIAIVALALQGIDQDSTQASVQLQGPQGELYLHTQIRGDMIRAPGEMANQPGKLFALQLPAGEYTFTRATGSWMIPSAMIGGREYFTLPLNTRFRVAAGEVVYLGSINLNINYRTAVSYSAAWERDQFDLLQRHGVTDRSNIQLRPLAAPAGQ